MTDTTISTDPATLRQAAYGIAQSYPAIADILYTIAAEKEAQAAPGNVAHLMAAAIAGPDAFGRYVTSGCADAARAVNDAMGKATAALSAITAAGYEIRPRTEKGERS